MGNSNSRHALYGESLLLQIFFKQVIDLVFMFDLVHEKHHVMFVLSEEVFSDLIVYNNFATSIQCVYIYICIYI